jgi:CO dehydrogenase/acetyl-CoA synthase beta subunit
MATFDSYLENVARQVEELRTRGRPVKELTCPTSASELTKDLPIRVGPGANPRIILRGETFVELGSPEAGSCGLVLWTDNPSLVSDGKITLIGPDIPESPAASLPFGQVLLVGGAQLGVDEHQSVGQAQYVADQIEGYMIKSSSRYLWGRVSKEAAAKGFCFEFLGRAVMAIYKSSLPKVEAVEALFVTSSKEDVLTLNEIAREAQEIGAKLVKEHWKARGYDLDCDLNCSSCSEKQVCDDIRKVLAARERKEREAEAERTA